MLPSGHHVCSSDATTRACARHAQRRGVERKPRFNHSVASVQSLTRCACEMRHLLELVATLATIETHPRVSTHAERSENGHWLARTIPLDGSARTRYGQAEVRFNLSAIVSTRYMWSLRQATRRHRSCVTFSLALTLCERVTIRENCEYEVNVVGALVGQTFARLISR